MKNIIKFYFKRVRRKVRRKPVGAKKYLEQKKDARRLVLERLEFWNKHYKFKYGRVSIRNQTTRWGSCSTKGNLNFNYRIATLSPDLLDYIVVHELCHIGQFNHSQKFWDLIGETLPDYVELQKKLKKIRFV